MKGPSLTSEKGLSTLPSDVLREGLVVSHLGKGLAVASETGETIICHTRRRLGDVAVGDRVRWHPAGAGQGRVVQVLPRKNVLARPGHTGSVRPVAANLDQVLIVVSGEPAPDLLLVDQFIAVCELRNIGVAFVFNKIDLLRDRSLITDDLNDYTRIGYGFFPVSAKTGEGVADLTRALKNRCNLLAGQSGVGKSSLSNALLPDQDLRISELSEKTRRGRHTTTAATLYRLPHGGSLIDSPGVAVFGLAEMSAGQLAQGYKEFAPYIEQCQFRDCLHVDDKNCAIRAAVDASRISKSRYLRYLQLLERLP
jgi:ribosome biogenesis GTPase